LLDKHAEQIRTAQVTVALRLRIDTSLPSSLIEEEWSDEPPTKDGIFGTEFMKERARTILG
jgi:hypothetical protein